MPTTSTALPGAPRSSDDLIAAVKRQRAERVWLATLWAYSRNPVTPISPGSMRVRQAQEQGLPARLISPLPNAHREIVIENDIGWRIATMVDFLFGKPIGFAGASPAISAALKSVWDASGGMALLHEVGLLGHTYGFVDLRLRESAGASRSPASGFALRIEAVPPERAMPFVSPTDGRALAAYGIVAAAGNTNNNTASNHNTASSHNHNKTQAAELHIELLSAGRIVWLSLASGTLTSLGSMADPLASAAAQTLGTFDDSARTGPPPIVHIQSVAQPLRYAGQSEVEPLIGLQNELNTRLSDRANRVTLQSFKMYLAKGLDGLDKAPVAPGTIWHTSNPDASIEAFGGDANSPSEESHINEIREAMDKVSSTPALATGVVRSKIGNLTSENALRVTLQGILTRTARKRMSYGRGITTINTLILARLNELGILSTTPAERTTQVLWQDPLPEQRTNQQSPAAMDPQGAWLG